MTTTSPTQARFAIVTPYYQESRATLERCLASVKAQTVKCDHFLVADGFAEKWIDGTGARHIRLDRPHRDYGNGSGAWWRVFAAAISCHGPSARSPRQKPLANERAGKLTFRP